MKAMLQRKSKLQGSISFDIWILTFGFLLCLLLVISLCPTPSLALPAQEVIPLVDSDYFPAVHEAILGAKKSVFCAMWLAQLSPRHPMGWESMLLRDLVNAKHRGVEVKVILEDSSDSDTSNRYAYNFLNEAGVAVFYDTPERKTHSKFVVIDEEITIVGSTNWTYSGLRLNHEASVLIRSREVAKAFKEAFDKIELKK